MKKLTDKLLAFFIIISFIYLVTKKCNNLVEGIVENPSPSDKIWSGKYIWKINNPKFLSNQTMDSEVQSPSPSIFFDKTLNINDLIDKYDNSPLLSPSSENYDSFWDSEEGRLIKTINDILAELLIEDYKLPQTFLDENIEGSWKQNYIER